jgi:hypothetical protein
MVIDLSKESIHLKIDSSVRTTNSAIQTLCQVIVAWMERKNEEMIWQTEREREIEKSQPIRLVILLLSAGTHELAEISLSDSIGAVFFLFFFCLPRNSFQSNDYDRVSKLYDLSNFQFIWTLLSRNFCPTPSSKRTVSHHVPTTRPTSQVSFRATNCGQLLRLIEGGGAYHYDSVWALSPEERERERDRERERERLEEKERIPGWSQTVVVVGHQ